MNIRNKIKCVSEIINEIITLSEALEKQGLLHVHKVLSQISQLVCTGLSATAHSASTEETSIKQKIP